MKRQKYVFAILISLFAGKGLLAQCLTLPNSSVETLNSSKRILEGKVVGQQSHVGPDGNIYTTNEIDVYRVFKGDVGFQINVVTEGGIHGDMMQVVTPSAQMQVGDYGLMVLDDQPSISNHASVFYPIDEVTGTVYGAKEITQREELYDLIARSVGTGLIELRRVPLESMVQQSASDRAAPVISSIQPFELTAGTQTVLTISGQGFGQTQGTGRVAFHNADDGGQSFVGLQAGPHYISWTDTEIQMYVPSSTLFNTTVAGSGSVRVVNANGNSTESAQQLHVSYAKSEVIYSDELNSTMLVGVQDGGYVYSMNHQMAAVMNGGALVQDALTKWACNTGVNFTLHQDVVNSTSWAHDGVNLIGFSNPGQLPSYLLGKTVTTFSSCGSSGELQWNLIEVDILLNSDIEWWMAEGQPSANTFDLSTAILHELGHAHLLQHNNNLDSPMYFQLMEGAMRRDLHEQADIEGGSHVTAEGVETTATCGDGQHQFFDFTLCDLSVINDVDYSDEAVFSVYPNPFKDQFTVSVGQLNASDYAILDNTGRVVGGGIIHAKDQVIPTSALAAGIYLFELRSDSETMTVRLIKN